MKDHKSSIILGAAIVFLVTVLAAIAIDIHNPTASSASSTDTALDNRAATGIVDLAEFMVSNLNVQAFVTSSVHVTPASNGPPVEYYYNDGGTLYKYRVHHNVNDANATTNRVFISD